MDTDWPRDSFHCMNFGILVFSRYMATSMPFSPFDKDCNSFCYVLILPLTCMLCLGQAWLCACLFIMFFKPFTASARLFAVSAAFSIFSARVIFPSLARSFLFSDFFVAGFFLCCYLLLFPRSVCCLLVFSNLTSWQISLLTRTWQISLLIRALLSLMFWPLGPFCAMARDLEPNTGRNKRIFIYHPGILKFEHGPLFDWWDGCEQTSHPL